MLDLRIRVFVGFVALVLISSASPSNAQVSSHLFNLSATGGLTSQQPWPVVSFGGIRVMENGTAWGEVNTAPDVYDFSSLDKWLADAKTGGQDVLYTFVWVPRWASSNPNDSTCRLGPGTCDPPVDLNPDGTGTDQHWKDYVTAITAHNKNSTTAHIKYWELWNEPHNNFSWNGTYAQLVRMVSDAYPIIKNSDPNAFILSPTLGWINKSALTWAAGYLGAGGSRYIDGVALHGYVMQSGKGGKTDNPETLTTLLPPYRTMLATYGLGSKPIFNTESSWSLNDQWGPFSTDKDMQAAFVARLYILHAVYGISRLYWFEWNDTSDGTLWLPDPNDPKAPGTVLKPGIAYQATYTWLVGKTTANSCSQAGTIWTCSITGANGYVSEAIWDTAESCSNGTCSTVSYVADSKYIHYQTLDGNMYSVSGNTVRIGAKPILLQNQ